MRNAGKGREILRGFIFSSITMVKIDINLKTEEKLLYIYKYTILRSGKYIITYYHNTGALTMAQFGELLAELRQDKRLTQKDLANILYVTDGTISNYENGVHLPDVEKLVSIADYFGVTTDYLLGRCSSSLSPDVFDEPIIGKKTAGELIREIREMNPEQKMALNVIISDMNFSMVVGKYGKEKQ